MGIKECRVNRYASMLYRASRSYYDQFLRPYHLTSGLPIFMLRIQEQPGLTLLELAENGRFDKGTTARAVHKLEKQGYARVERDPKDRRVCHIYLTQQAAPVLEACYELLEQWEQVILQGFTPQEKGGGQRLPPGASPPGHIGPPGRSLNIAIAAPPFGRGQFLSL